MTRRIKQNLDTSLRVLVFNAQSIRNKMDLFRSLMVVEKPDIVGISETWIHTKTRDFEGEYELKGYRMFKKDRIDKEGGGVLLYIREHLDPIECKSDSNHEMLGVCLNKLDKKLHIYIVYRPPHQSTDKDDSLYSSLKTAIRNKMCILMGDFNCNIDWQARTANSEGQRLLDFANEEFLTQWVKKPTRGNNILDLVFSTEENIVTKLDVGEKLGKGDHNMIRFEIKVSNPRNQKSFKKLNFKRANFDRLRAEIRDINTSGNMNVEDIWQSHKASFMIAQSYCIPQTEVKANKTENPKWFTRNIEKAIKNRQKSYRLSKMQPNQENKRKHYLMCRQVNKMIRQAKLDYEDRIASTGSPRLTSLIRSYTVM
ncbi:MAG: endonuclease/exonuclease/phosphatase family protein [Cyanobacteria bacterium J06582_2]